jgi:shikimate kinase
MDNKLNNIILCGFMGTGKTTVGKIVAARLGWEFSDTDSVIEGWLGRSIKQIFAEDGEAVLRYWENRYCEEMIRLHNQVIATGGGIVVNPANREAMSRAGLVICLDAPAEEIAARLSGMEMGITDRPLLAGADPTKRIADLLASRAEAYAALPFHVNTGGLTPEAVAGAILALWEQHHANP